MAALPSPAPLYSFPGGRLLCASNELEIGGRIRSLEPKHVETLACLLDRPGEVVRREEILESVWQGRHVTDDVLTVSIYKLRRALGETARRPRFIETVSRRGYRWIALPVARPRETTGTAPRPPAGGRRIPAPVDPPHSASGIAGRTFRGRKRPAPPKRRVRLRYWATTAGLLVAIAAGSWNGGKLEEAALSRAPDIALDEAERLVTERRPASLDQALEIAHWRLASDPEDAAALALEARALTFAAELQPEERQRRFARARQAATSAAAVAPASSRALLAQGLVALLGDRDLPAAERALLKAARADPNDPEVLQGLSWWLSVEGHHEAAIRAARAAVARDPDISTRWSDLAFLQQAGGDWAGAIRTADLTLAMDPTDAASPQVRLWSKRALGRTDEAVEEYLDHLAVRGVPRSPLSRLRRAYEAGGWRAYHRAYVELLPPGSSPLDEAVADLQEGDEETALSRLEAAARRGDPLMLWLDSMPELAALGTNPRFEGLRGRLGLARGSVAEPRWISTPFAERRPARSWYRLAPGA